MGEYGSRLFAWLAVSWLTLPSIGLCSQAVRIARFSDCRRPITQPLYMYARIYGLECHRDLLAMFTECSVSLIKLRSIFQTSYGKRNTFLNVFIFESMLLFMGQVSLPRSQLYDEWGSWNKVNALYV